MIIFCARCGYEREKTLSDFYKLIRSLSDRVLFFLVEITVNLYRGGIFKGDKT